MNHAFGFLLCASLAAAQMPRIPDGHPDLQGIWTNATLTPFQRPADLGEKQFFTEREAAAFEKQRIEQNDVDRVEGPRGAADLARRAYNNVWLSGGRGWFRAGGLH